MTIEAKDNDLSPDEIGNRGATSDQWLFLTWRRADGAVPVTVRTRHPTVAARKSINFRPPGRVSCPAEQRLRPSLQRWRSEQMAIGRSQ